MNKFKVPIKNALFMYSYIWDKAESRDLINLDANDTFNSSNIYAELFIINVKKILLRGLYKEYINKNECLTSIKGRIDLKSTIDKQTLVNGKIYCYYDEYEENNIFNQIIKNTALKLYKSKDLSKDNKKKLNSVIFGFNKVDYIEINKNHFRNLKYNKMNNYYYIMMKICELILSNQMLSEDSGKYEFMDLFNDDKNMNTVFELFINKFYQQELPKEYKVKYQSVLKWNFIGGNKDLLPDMKMDTLITSRDKTIVLDTKYYKNYFVENGYGKKKLRSNHFYQMISYLNNIECDNKLSGILLYPKPYEDETIDEVYTTKVPSRKTNEVIDVDIRFVTIDLSEEWFEIKRKLKNIILS